MKLLFVTRAYPPVVGGMEKFSNDFYHSYRNIAEIDLLANLGGKKTLIPFLFQVIFTLVVKARKYDVVHFGDATMSIFIPLVKLSSRAKISLTVHGLDIVYHKFGYQRVIPILLKKADRIFTVSHFTMEQCALRGIPKIKLKVIPNGVNFTEVKSCDPLEWTRLRRTNNILNDGKKILLTVGRLIPRKGHSWFIANVITKLSDNYVYIIAGNGPEKKNILDVVRANNLGDKVHVLGEVTEAEKSCLYCNSDLFIMPNIRAQNDQEGFGIVLLEAGMYGLPVIASNIEGIRDAVIEGQTGRLVGDHNIEGFIGAIENPGVENTTIPDIVKANFDWKNIAKRYSEEFQKMTI
jgi:glycosyltransferase involved in cell wall biosynthesis